MTTDMHTPKDIPDSVRRILSVPKGKYDVPTFITYRRNGIKRHVIVDIGEPVIKEAWAEWCRFNPSADPEAFLLVVYSLTRHEIPRLYRAVGEAELTPPHGTMPTAPHAGSMGATPDDVSTPDPYTSPAVPADIPTDTPTVTVDTPSFDSTAPTSPGPVTHVIPVVMEDAPVELVTAPDTPDNTPEQSTLDVKGEIRKRKKVNKVREIPNTTD